MNLQIALMGDDHHAFTIPAEPADLFFWVFIKMDDRVHTITFFHLDLIGW
jgi:hypothetical protein